MQDRADAYACPGCGYCFSGYNRSPPYPHCPKCRDKALRQLTHDEFALVEAGFIPQRLNS